MFSRIHDRLGTAGLVIAVIALIAALAGTAFAAAGLNSKQKKEVTKIAKKYAGKQGPKGDTGPPGPAGAKGDTGAKGDNGSAGTNGQDGVSPTGTNFSGTKGACTEGGIEYNGATTNLVCNGEQGEPGSPWVPDGTLPVGATETGAFATTSKGSNFSVASISFNIPLEAALDAAHVQSNGIGFPAADETLCNEKSEPEKGECLATLATSKANCPGSGVNPQAASGFLCVYTVAAENTAIPAILRGRGSIQKLDALNAEEDIGADVSGASFFVPVEESAITTKVTGSYAVTG